MKLSQRKAEYVLGIAREIEGGTLDLEALKRASDDEVVERVTRLRGVGIGRPIGCSFGPYPGQMPFPLGILALKRVVSQLYFDGGTLTDQEMEEFSLRWVALP